LTNSALVMEAFRRGITLPSPQTLRRYGITADQWLQLLADQGWKCPICLKTGPDVKWNTDHEHVRGWDKLSDKERARYTRGILCAYCNHRRVHSSNTAVIAFRIAVYIFKYELRRLRSAT
jgi:DNA-directed RNA polymerase subunit RPC12/RpoP